MPLYHELTASVLVATLHVDSVHFLWAHALRRLRWPGPFQDPVPVVGMPYDHARNHACQIALDHGASHIFFLDSDVAPPSDAIERLLSHGLPLVSGVYCRRSVPHGVPVMQRGGQWVTNLPSPKENPLIEVDVVGAGMMLISTDLLRQCPPQRDGYHWFDWRVNLPPKTPQDKPGMSEDFTFCLHVKHTMGIPTIVDTSIRSKHQGMAEADFNSYAPIGSTPYYRRAA